jgi:hypothetical protein
VDRWEDDFEKFSSERVVSRAGNFNRYKIIDFPKPYPGIDIKYRYKNIDKEYRYKNIDKEYR